MRACSSGTAKAGLITFGLLYFVDQISFLHFSGLDAQAPGFCPHFLHFHFCAPVISDCCFKIATIYIFPAF